MPPRRWGESNVTDLVPHVLIASNESSISRTSAFRSSKGIGDSLGRNAIADACWLRLDHLLFLLPGIVLVSERTSLPASRRLCGGSTVSDRM